MIVVLIRTSDFFIDKQTDTIIIRTLLKSYSLEGTSKQQNREVKKIFKKKKSFIKDLT